MCDYCEKSPLMKKQIERLEKLTKNKQHFFKEISTLLLIYNMFEALDKIIYVLNEHFPEYIHRINKLLLLI